MKPKPKGSIQHTQFLARGNASLINIWNFRTEIECALLPFRGGLSTHMDTSIVCLSPVCVCVMMHRKSCLHVTPLA